MRTAGPPTSESGLRRLGKYAVHGVAFAVIFTIFGLAWAVVTLLLVLCGLLLGLVIGVVLYFVLMGFVNAMITETLWFRVKTGFLSCLGHGLLLTLALLPLNLVAYVVQSLVAPSVLAGLIFFLATSPLMGFLGKAVASVWEIPPLGVAAGLVPPSAPAAPPLDPPPK